MGEAEPRGDRVPLSRVQLTGMRLYIHRALMISVMSLVVTAMVTYFMNWHEIHEGFVRRKPINDDFACERGIV